MARNRPESPLIVCAIDFGTTYSGYAFSFKNKPTDVIANQTWVAGTTQLMSHKNPTCVLLDPGKNFVAFGFEAENKYSDLAEDNKHADWFLFRNFKMVLYEKKDITRNTLVEDIRGKRVDAMTVFSHAIRYMVCHFLKACEKQLGEVEDKDIQYILTVPAIWNDKSKQFMRESANKAGLPGYQLSIALEPEAASIWGQVVTDDSNMKLSNTGVQYIIADLGGGTTDITAHQKLEDGTLKELHRASGGPWGGSLVDHQYLAFLQQIFGQDVMTKFIDQKTSDYIDLLRDFEVKKRTITSKSEDKLSLRFPASLREICEAVRHTSLQKLVELSDFSSRIRVSSDKLRMDVALVRDFFTPALDGLMSHMQTQLQHENLREIKIILLAGGFGECSLVQDAFKKHFPSMKLIVPQDASLTVLKGAARFGHMRDIICSRKAKYAYGLGETKAFNAEIHPLEKKIVKYGQERCNHLFDKCVNVGEDLFPGKEVQHNYLPIHVDKTSQLIRVYCSESNDTRFTDDPGCHLLGHIRVPLPEGDTRQDKGFTVRLLFWGTEITVFVRMDNTGEEYETIVDCM